MVVDVFARHKASWCGSQACVPLRQRASPVYHLADGASKYAQALFGGKVPCTMTCYSAIGSGDVPCLIGRQWLRGIAPKRLKRLKPHPALLSRARLFLGSESEYPQQV
jgi:hypothetical protein